MTFSQIISNTLRAKHFHVKQFVHVAPKWKRDARGRFAGGLIRKGYTRKIYDRVAPKVSNMTLLAENVTANNALLSSLIESGNIVSRHD